MKKQIAISMSLLMAAISSMIPTQVGAQEYPNRPITLIIPFGSGGPSDIIGRLTAMHLSEVLGQPVVPENRPGGGGSIGAAAAAAAEADGYTLLLGTSSNLVVNPLLRSDLQYDVSSDLLPISLISSGQFTLAVSPSLPVDSVAELLAYSAENPDSLNMGSGGIGGTAHLTGEMFRAATGLAFHHIPYRSGGEATQAVVAGEVDFVFDAVPVTRNLHVEGRLKILGVTGEERDPLLEDIPTMAELGVEGFTATFWNGLVAQADVTPDIVAKLSQAIQEVVEKPAFVEAVARLGMVAVSSTPEEFERFIGEETSALGPVIEAADISMD